MNAHGYSSYTTGCRCDICRAAKAQRERERRAEMKQTGGSDLRPRVSPPKITAGWVAPSTDELRWQDFAACLTEDAEVFFRDDDEDEAKRICSGCPVVAECRSLALLTRPSHGVWAAMTADEIADERSGVAA